MPLALAATATARIRRTDPSRNPGSRSFDCQVYDVWGQPLDPSQTRMNGSFLFSDCSKISHFLHSLARMAGGLVIEGVTIGAGAGGYCFRVRGRFRGFCDQGGGVEGCAKARGMRLILMAHFALVVRKRSRHRVHSLVDKKHNRYRL